MLTVARIKKILNKLNEGAKSLSYYRWNSNSWIETVTSLREGCANLDAQLRKYLGPEDKMDATKPSEDKPDASKPAEVEPDVTQLLALNKELHSLITKAEEAIKKDKNIDLVVALSLYEDALFDNLQTVEQKLNESKRLVNELTAQKANAEAEAKEGQIIKGKCELLTEQNATLDRYKSSCLRIMGKIQAFAEIIASSPNNPRVEKLAINAICKLSEDILKVESKPMSNPNQLFSLKTVNVHPAQEEKLTQTAASSSLPIISKG